MHQSRAEIIGHRNTLVSQILSPSSTRTYSRAWDLFKEFSALFETGSKPLLPASVSDMTLFVAFLDSKGLAPATTATYISAVAFQHKMAGLPDPTGAFIIQKLLQATRYNRIALDTRLPITEPLLVQLCRASLVVTPDKFKQQLFNTMMVVAFWVFFRVGEITSKGKFPCRTDIKLTDLTFNRQRHGETVYATITLRWFKHHRGGEPWQVVMNESLTREICPVTALMAYLKSKCHTQGNLFTFVDGAPVQRSWFTGQLDRTVAFCGLDPTRYKAHSFRIGAATSAAARGMSDAQIRLAGRWKSDAFKKYIGQATP